MPVRLDLEEIGAPDGTSVVVRNLFYNVPVRSRFLKQPQTEAGYITDLIERQALSHPGISFHYRVDGKEKLHTTGNGDLKELIYRIYGREISKKVLPVRGPPAILKSSLSTAGCSGAISSPRRWKPDTGPTSCSTAFPLRSCT